MHRVALTIGLSFLGISGYIIWASKDLEYYTKLGPGGGFFPLWLGVIMSGLTLIWLIQEIRKKERIDHPFIPAGADIMRIIFTIIALLAVSLLMDLIGFQLTMFFFLIFLLKILGKQSLLISLIVALLGSFGIYHIFTRFLDVILPMASLKFLSNLGI